MQTPTKSALDVLREGADSYLPFVREDGELLDPVFHESAQYGTPYLAYCQAVLARFAQGQERDRRAQAAYRIFCAALTHASDPLVTPNLSGASRDTGATSCINHRDFFWPPILKSFVILRQLLGADALSEAEKIIRNVDVFRQFMSRPPSNWCAVWMSGEFIRIREGLSKITMEQFDDWLEVFFRTHIDLDMGFYHEGGHPNSYDLFTRFHLQDLIAEGYDGRWRSTLESLLDSGLRRSLAVQLSDGSMASAYRSTGQTWTVGVQCAYFTEVAEFLKDTDPLRAARAQVGAEASFRSFVRWQRPGGLYSPVENVLPSAYRIGYEGYSFDANYGCLALGFLATSLLHGFSAGQQGELSPHPEPLVYIEQDPTYRAIAHRGVYSVHANAFPSPAYDGFGLVDITFGLDRRLQFASSVRYLGDPRFYNLGIASRADKGRSPITPIAWESLTLTGPIEPVEGATGFKLTARVKGKVNKYDLKVVIDDAGIDIEEATWGDGGYKTLIVPYLRDGGDGHTSVSEVLPQGDRTRIVLTMQSERVEILIDAAISNYLELPYGFENRRGLCSMLRLDLANPTDIVRYRIAAH